MAIRMQGYRNGTPNMGGGFQRPTTSVPPSGRTNAPQQPVRIDAADIFKNMTGRTISNDGSPVVDAALSVAKMIPGLARMHPYLRIADLLNIAWKIWRATKFERDRTSFATHGAPHVAVPETPITNGWNQQCSVGADPAYPYYAGHIYSAGDGGPTLCGLGFQDFPLVGAQTPDASWPGATLRISDWGPNIIGGQDRSYIRSQWDKPAGSEFEPMPFDETNPMPTELQTPSGTRFQNPDPVPYSAPDLPVTAPVDVIPKLQPEWPSERGNDTPPDTQTGSDSDWPPLYSFRSPPGPRVKEVKFKASALNNALQAGLTAVGALHGKLTDLRDIVKALDESLPKHLQSKSKKLQDIIANVYKHADKLNASKALLGIIKELAEDQVGGLGDHFATESAKKNGWTKQKFHLSARF